MADYTLIIQNYYLARQKYWPQIAASIDKWTHPPAARLIWDNAKLIDWPAHVIRSSRNTLLGRYAAALVCETDYIVVQDNDLLLGPQTVKQMLQAAVANPDKIVGAFGSKLARSSPHPYTEGRAVASGPCDIVLGRAWACHRKALIPGIHKILTENLYPGRNDDILFSMAGYGGLVVEGCEWINLDEEGQGLSHDRHHFEERNQFTRKMIVDGY